MSEYKPRCIGENKVHKPDYLIKLYQIETGPVGEGVAVSWCAECGAVSVDREYDGRFHHSIIGLKYPYLLEMIGKLLKSEKNKLEDKVEWLIIF